MPRKRKPPRLGEQLAAALACLLPQADRDELRRARAPWKKVRARFEMHHIDRHALGGCDEWHNLHPMVKGSTEHRAQRDMTVVAKVRRIEPKWREFTADINAGRKPAKRKSTWGSRPLRSRSSWPKRQ